MTEFAPKEILADRYEIISKLGEGAMGVVLDAIDLHNQKKCAIKILKNSDSDTRLKRFEEEGRCIALLNSPHIVKFYEIGVNENGIRFVVMEKLEGESLAEVMDRRQFSEIEGIYVVQRLLKALLVVHQANLIHRDLKPANIFVCRLDPKKPMEHASNVKLLDFGIVKDLNSDQQITATNIWVGTPKYMSPEAFDPKKSFSDKSDLYSIGILLYRFVSGEFPFFVKHPALPKHYTSLPAPVQISWLHLHAKPADLQHPLNPLIQQLLSKKPEDRPNTAEVLKILEQHYDYIPNVVDFFSETIADDLNFDTTMLQRIDLNLMHDVHLKETVKFQRPVAFPTTHNRDQSAIKSAIHNPPQAHQSPQVHQIPSLSDIKIIAPPKSFIAKIIEFFRLGGRMRSTP
jgi:serine/threonine protein kinase